MPEPLCVSLLGFGEVGRAFAARFADDPAVRVVSVTDRSGTVTEPDLAALLAHKEARGAIGGERGRDARWAVAHAPADVVVDALPTDLRDATAAADLACEALARGRHLVLASKGALALEGARVQAAARRAGRRVLASATVCGGTPALELVEHAFRGDALERFEAVLNGSTNAILSRLEEGARLEDAIAEARAQGILEADPALDLLGLDAAAKATILANHAWGWRFRLADAQTEGILGLRPGEAAQARRSGFAIRLVARGSPAGVSVAPVTLPRDHPLVVEGRENAVRLKLRDAGPIVLRGAGAGGRETAAALASDVLRLAPQFTTLRPTITRDVSDSLQSPRPA